MFDPTRYHYTLKPDRMSQLKLQFYRQICIRNGDQQHLSKAQLIHFLSKQGLDIKMSQLPYYDQQLFKQQNKLEYSCRETITLVDRLSINNEVQKQYEKVFKVFDYADKSVITAFQLKKGIRRSGCIDKLDDSQIEEIFCQLDVDQDGLVSFEDFLCAMVSK